MSPVPKIATVRGGRNLCYNALKHSVRRGKRDAAFDLNFKADGLSAIIVSVDDNIVEWMTLGRALEVNPIDPCSGQPSRLGARQE
jgi:hypothetical protein